MHSLRRIHEDPKIPSEVGADAKRDRPYPTQALRHWENEAPRSEVLNQLHTRFLEVREKAYESRRTVKLLREEYASKTEQLKHLSEVNASSQTIALRRDQLRQVLLAIVERLSKPDFSTLTQAERSALLISELKKISQWNAHIGPLMALLNALQSDPVKPEFSSRKHFP